MIAIFKEVTTEGAISLIEENSKRYHDGFYADVNDLPQRVLVKSSAKDIKDIIKQVESARKSIAREFTTKVNSEAKEIISRLEIANKPFTDLLDAYNVERKKFLDAKKEHRETIKAKEKHEDTRAINNEAMSSLVELGLSENNAKAVVAAIAKNKIKHIQINY